MKHSTTEAMNATTPVIQVNTRLPRHAAIQNLPHKWMTRKAMNASTLHMCRLLKKWPDRVGVPPIGTAEGDGDPREDHQPQGGQAGHAEHVDPRSHVGRLAVGEQFSGGSLRSTPRRTRDVHMAASASSPRSNAPATARRWARGRPVATSPSRPARRPSVTGKGRSRAAPKITTMTAIRTRLASETVKIDQCRYRPGPFKSTAAANRALKNMGEISHGSGVPAGDPGLGTRYGVLSGPLVPKPLAKGSPKRPIERSMPWRARSRPAMEELRSPRDFLAMLGLVTALASLGGGGRLDLSHHPVLKRLVRRCANDHVT